MHWTITDVDGPADLAARAPLVVDLLREIPGPDRPDYWIAMLREPFMVMVDNLEYQISHLVVTARWQGTSICHGAKHIPLGVAYVVDNSLLSDAQLDFAKCKYVAIAMGTDSTDGAVASPLRQILSGTIGRAFGLGKQND